MLKVSREVKQLSGAIAESLQDEAGPSGLVYIEQTEHLPGFTRKRSGEQFIYLDIHEATITDKKIVARIKALAIPPAWSKVWICPVVNGHLRATGRDAKGRRQYLYHSEWRTQRDTDKFENLVEFGRELPRLRQRVSRDMRQRSLSKTRMVATIVRLLEDFCCACVFLLIHQSFTRDRSARRRQSELR
jgi:DNA topoisomerase I